MNDTKICEVCEGSKVLGMLKSQCYRCGGSGNWRPIEALETSIIHKVTTSDKIRDLRDSGKTVAEISRTLNIPYNFAWSVSKHRILKQ